MNPEVVLESYSEAVENEPSFSCESQLGAAALCASCPLLRLLGDCPKVLRGDDVIEPMYQLPAYEDADGNFEIVQKIDDSNAPIEEVAIPAAVSILSDVLREVEAAKRDDAADLEVIPEAIKSTFKPGMVSHRAIDDMKVITSYKESDTRMVYLSEKKKPDATVQAKQNATPRRSSKAKEIEIELVADYTAALRQKQKEKQAEYYRLLFDDTVPIVSVWQTDPVETIRVDTVPFVTLPEKVMVPVETELITPVVNVEQVLVPVDEMVVDVLYEEYKSIVEKQEWREQPKQLKQPIQPEPSVQLVPTTQPVQPESIKAFDTSKSVDVCIDVPIPNGQSSLISKPTFKPKIQANYEPNEEITPSTKTVALVDLRVRQSVDCIEPNDEPLQQLTVENDNSSQNYSHVNVNRKPARIQTDFAKHEPVHLVQTQEYFHTHTTSQRQTSANASIRRLFGSTAVGHLVCLNGVMY